MHHPVDPFPADSLYSLGEELPDAVCPHSSPTLLTLRVCRGTLLCAYSQLFGEDENAGGELDEAEKQGENGRLRNAQRQPRVAECIPIAQEIATLRKEALAFKAVRAALRTPHEDGSSSAARIVFQKVVFLP